MWTDLRSPHGCLAPERVWDCSRRCHISQPPGAEGVGDSRWCGPMVSMVKLGGAGIFRKWPRYPPPPSCLVPLSSRPRGRFSFLFTSRVRRLGLLDAHSGSCSGPSMLPLPDPHYVPLATYLQVLLTVPPYLVSLWTPGPHDLEEKRLFALVLSVSRWCRIWQS